MERRAAWLEPDRDELRRFLVEDWGARDATSDALLRNETGTAELMAREACVLAGLEEAAALFEIAGARLVPSANDGERATANSVFARVEGPLAAILKAERVALNMVGRMSGIATVTRDLAERVRRKNPYARVAATRKTTPGFRRYEKKAVVLGGGETHRMTLAEAVLIKDNHSAAVGSVTRAIELARKAHTGPIEIEVSTPLDAEAAAKAGVEWVLIDNLPPAQAEELARIVKRLSPKTKIEVSGGLRPENVEQYAPFADRLSLGWLTHSARSVDVTLTVHPRAARKS
jgi:nicotinate-nucleotide pyrophosphorylase (carboxylating)